MQKWIAFLLSSAIAVAFVVGLFIQPVDSEANNTSYWRAAFYDNTELDGTPIYTRNDRTIEFNWAAEAPAPGVPVDGFSARWSGAFEFEAGDWEFSVGADDGVRFWINDRLVIDQWGMDDNAYAVFTEVITLKRGVHDLQLEYQDVADLAGVHVRWDRAISPPNDDTPAREEGSDPVTVAQDGDEEERSVANVTTGVLNVRTGPGIQFERITQIFLYQRYRILGQNATSTWYQIDLRDGRLGWVSARYVLVTGSKDIDTIVFNNEDPTVVFDGAQGAPLYRLNLRAEPDGDSDIIGIVPYEATVVVQGRDASSIWYLVTYDGVDGWVFAPYIVLDRVPVYDLPFVD